MEKTGKMTLRTRLFAGFGLVVAQEAGHDAYYRISRHGLLAAASVVLLAAGVVPTVRNSRTKSSETLYEDTEAVRSESLDDKDGALCVTR